MARYDRMRNGPEIRVTRGEGGGLGGRATGAYDDVRFGRELRYGRDYPVGAPDAYDYGILGHGSRHVPPYRGYDARLHRDEPAPRGREPGVRGYDRGWGTSGLFEHIRHAPIGRRGPGGRVGRGSGLGRTPEGITAPRYDHRW
jgi:hypothetical protein